MYIYVQNVALNKFSLQKVPGLLSFGPCPNCISSVNIVAEIQLNERVIMKVYNGGFSPEFSV